MLLQAGSCKTQRSKVTSVDGEKYSKAQKAKLSIISKSISTCKKYDIHIHRLQLVSLIIRARLHRRPHGSQLTHLHNKKKRRKSAHFPAPHVRPAAVAVKTNPSTENPHPAKYPKIASTDLRISPQPTNPNHHQFSFFRSLIRMPHAHAIASHLAATYGGTSRSEHRFYCMQSISEMSV